MVYIINNLILQEHFTMVMYKKRQEIYIEIPRGSEEYLKLERGEVYYTDEYCVLLLITTYV